MLAPLVQQLRNLYRAAAAYALLVDGVLKVKQTLHAVGIVERDTIVHRDQHMRQLFHVLRGRGIILLVLRQSQRAICALLVLGVV